MKFEHKPLASYTRISQKYSILHKGLDLAASKGTAIYAVADGTIYKAGDGALDDSYGNQVVIKHSDGSYTNYAHMSKIVKQSGSVSAGAKIGEVGMTGNAIGNHLHLEVHDGALWNRVDPLPYLEAVGSGSSSGSTPTYTVGNTYTLLVNLNVRTGAGTNYSKKKKSALTADAQKHATSSGVLKKGTRVTCKQVKTVGSNIWIKIPSGWVAAYYNGKVYVK